MDAQGLLLLRNNYFIVLYFTLLTAQQCADINGRSKTENKEQTKTQQQCVDVDDDDYDQSLFYFTLLYLTLL